MCSSLAYSDLEAFLEACLEAVLEACLEAFIASVESSSVSSVSHYHDIAMALRVVHYPTAGLTNL